MILKSTIYSINFLDAAYLDTTPYLGDASERFYPGKLARAELKPGTKVLEGGTGSGFLATEIARIICPTGRVYSYDVKIENLEAAKRNLKLAGLEECVELKHGDVRVHVSETDLDAALLNIPDPWEALKTLKYSLKNGAPLVAFIPTMNQIVKLVEKLTEDWIIVKTLETIEREVETTREAVRPSRASPFTGYIIVLRKIS